MIMFFLVLHLLILFDLHTSFILSCPVISVFTQVLRPLEGAGFKEAGAYALKNGRHAGVGSNLASKLHRFPFIEAMELPDGMTSTFQQQQPHSIDKEMDNGVGKVEGKISFEPFVSADGSVGYMFESAGIPQQIWADTRGNAKVSLDFTTMLKKN